MTDSPLWHPCTQMHRHQALPPIKIIKAQGAYLYPEQGKPMLDLISSWWVNLHGHCHPFINQKVNEQLATLEHTMLAGLTHEPAEQLAQSLVELTPAHLAKVFFADSGSAAIEVALKMSLQYWHQSGEPHRKTFISLEQGYHGETLGSLSVTDIPLFTAQYQQLLINHVKAPSPDLSLKPSEQSVEEYIEQRLDTMRLLLEQYVGQVCAVIVEPLVQGAAGMKMYPVSYLDGLGKLCAEFNVHLIFDEIAVGFGRTGTLFAVEQTTAKPDFVCLSKGLTAGYLPMSCVLTTLHVYDAFYDEDVTKAFLHSHSFTGSPMAAAAANASLALFRTGAVLQNNTQLIDVINNQLMQMSVLPYVSHVRQTGMIAALSLVDPQSKEPIAASVMQWMTSILIKDGFWVRPIGHHVYIIPPYCITQDQLTCFFAALKTVVGHALQQNLNGDGVSVYLA